MSGEVLTLAPVQPDGVLKPKNGVVRYNFGAKRSIAKLKKLGYDPITILVATHNYICLEIERQEKIRDGQVVELTTTGKVKAYRPEVHHALLDRLIKIGENLMRFKYGRVPEVLEQLKDPPKSLIINLTKKGEKYELSPYDEAQPEEPFEDD